MGAGRAGQAGGCSGRRARVLPGGTLCGVPPPPISREAAPERRCQPEDLNAQELGACCLPGVSERGTVRSPRRETVRFHTSLVKKQTRRLLAGPSGRPGVFAPKAHRVLCTVTPTVSVLILRMPPFFWVSNRSVFSPHPPKPLSVPLSVCLRAPLPSLCLFLKTGPLSSKTTGP